MDGQFKHELGALVKDRISGIQGIVVNRTEFLYGCRRYGVQMKGEKEGKPHESFGADEDALEPVEQGKTGTVRDTGGDRELPHARPAPPAR